MPRAARIHLRCPPAPVVARLQEAVQQAIATPVVQQRLGNAGVDGMSSTAAEPGRFIAAEREKWGRVVRQARIAVE